MRLIHAQRIMFAVFIFFTFFLPNCSDQQRSGLRSLPTALGSPTQTLLVVDNDFDGTVVGDSILFNFQAAYPLLPAPEPMLDLTVLKFDDFFGMKQQWRNIIFIANLDEPSAIVDFIENTIGEEAVQNAKDNQILIMQLKMIVGQKINRSGSFLLMANNNWLTLFRNVRRKSLRKFMKVISR